MQKKMIWVWVLEALGIGLLLFTASRTFDLLQSILGQENSFFCIMALCALDGGLVGWTRYYIHGARGDQRNVAIISIIFDLVGVSIAFIADMFLRGGRNGFSAGISNDAAGLVILALAVVIAYNIAAVIVAAIVDPKTRLRHAEEEAEFEVENETLKEIKKNSKTIAKQLAKQRADMWSDHTKSEALHDSEQRWGGTAGPTKSPSPNGSPALALPDGETSPKAANPALGAPSAEPDGYEFTGILPKA